ncbi:MAG TPA: hypothetical protein VK846_00705 [Candidatus Limnocylindria bacterium]|nr:hypothetical protein [Candidatus Limnocylindria bacterium]
MSTHTYTILEVATATFNDLQARLARAGVLREFLAQDDGRNVLIFGTVAIAEER